MSKKVNPAIRRRDARIQELLGALHARQERIAKLSHELELAHNNQQMAKAETCRVKSANDALRTVMGHMLKSFNGCFAFRNEAMSSVPLIRLKRDSLLEVHVVYIGDPNKAETKDPNTLL